MTHNYLVCAARLTVCALCWTERYLLMSNNIQYFPFNAKIFHASNTDPSFYFSFFHFIWCHWIILRALFCEVCLILRLNWQENTFSFVATCTWMERLLFSVNCGWNEIITAHCTWMKYKWGTSIIVLLPGYLSRYRYLICSCICWQKGCRLQW